MQVSTPNENGVLNEGHRETVARLGRAHATITIALCEDGLFRYGLEMMYSYGGFGFPIRVNGVGFATMPMLDWQALKRCWHACIGRFRPIRQASMRNYASLRSHSKAIFGSRACFER